MTILVTGSTGTIGTQVLAHLDPAVGEVRALTRSPEKAKFPDWVKPVQGDLADADSMRAAMQGVSSLFLLAANSADEFTQAMLALDAAREERVTGIVYLSVFKAKEYWDVPHFASKYSAEHLIEQANLPATILRPAYFIQNDVRQKDALLTHGVFANPIGSKGISMVDTRDIGEAAAKELMRRERSATALPRETYALVGPDALTAESITSIWSQALGRPIRYGGDDLEVMEQRMKNFAPAWLAYDMKLMMRRYQQEGAVATSAEIAKLTQLLGHAPRNYEDFAQATAKHWAGQGK